MNLRGIANTYTRTVNPNVRARIERSAGYTTRDDGQQVPNYDKTDIECQVQALTYSDLMKLDGLNIQGTRRAIYVNGAVSSIIRAKQVGGDVVRFAPGLLPEGDVWLCVHVLEQWQDGGNGAAWAKFAITLQNGS